MKIRLGFVSNSSSSSYIVHIHNRYYDSSDFLADIYRLCSSAIEEYENEYFDNLGEEIDYDDSIIFSEMNQNRKQPRVRRFTNDNGCAKYIKSKSEQVAALQYLFLEEYINIEEVGNGRFSLSSFSSMHNSFNDMNDLLKNIYLEFVVDSGGATLIRESDN